MTLRAVVFDLWGTLIHDADLRARPRQEWRARNVKAALQRYGVAVEIEAVDLALRSANEDLMRLHDLGRDVSSLGRVDLVLGRLALARGAVAEACLPELEAAIIAMRQDLAPYLAGDAVETLSTVKAAGLRTALVSNAGFTAARTLRQMLAGYRISRYLDVLVFSDEIEMAKPDPRVFAAALDALDLQPAEAAFVGDSPHNDIAGAQAAGLFAVQIGSRSHDSVRPDARITRLGELLPLLRGHFALPYGEGASS